jgi:hypothetical protein
VISVITITGIGDHLQPEWLITFTGMRSVNVIARDDDITFGILHSRFHETWSLRLGGWHGVGNDPQYTPSMGFETYPFPDGFTPNVSAAASSGDPRGSTIAAAARRLNELREQWLNPADFVRRVPEVIHGLPEQIRPLNDAAETALKKRTLTILYNERPAWLEHAHARSMLQWRLAYGWPSDIAEEDALAGLLELNRERGRNSENAVRVRAAMQAVRGPVGSETSR